MVFRFSHLQFAYKLYMRGIKIVKNYEKNTIFNTSKKTSQFCSDI